MHTMFLSVAIKFHRRTIFSRKERKKKNSFNIIKILFSGKPLKNQLCRK